MAEWRGDACRKNNPEAYERLKSEVPCLARAKREFAHYYGPVAAMADTLLHDDCGAYVEAASAADF